MMVTGHIHYTTICTRYSVRLPCGFILAFSHSVYYVAYTASQHPMGRRYITEFL